MVLDYKTSCSLYYKLSVKYGIIGASPGELVDHIANLVSDEICGSKSEHEYLSMVQDYRMLVKILDNYGYWWKYAV